MKLFLFVLIMTQNAFSVEIPLNSKHVQASGFNATFITTDQTRPKTVITAKAMLNRDVCLNTETTSWESTCEDCRQDLVCYGEDNCQYVTTCTTYTCTKSATSCVEWGKVYYLDDIKIKLKSGFLGMRAPKAGQKIEMSLPSKEGDQKFSIKVDGIEKFVDLKRNKVIKIKI